MIAFGLLGLLRRRPAAAKVGSNATTTPAAAAPQLTIENAFMSATGWVKPGQSYVRRVVVKNSGDAPRKDVAVRIASVPGMALTSGSPATPADGKVLFTSDKIVWNVSSVPAATEAGPGIRTLIVEGRAKTLSQDPTIVWKDLSMTAAMTVSGSRPRLRAAPARK